MLIIVNEIALLSTSIGHLHKREGRFLCFSTEEF